MLGNSALAALVLQASLGGLGDGVGFGLQASCRPMAVDPRKISASKLGELFKPI